MAKWSDGWNDGYTGKSGRRMGRAEMGKNVKTGKAGAAPSGEAQRLDDVHYLGRQDHFTCGPQRKSKKLLLSKRAKKTCNWHSSERPDQYGKCGPRR